MKDMRVWYTLIGSLVTGSMTLTIQRNAPIYTIAEYESRNKDMRITHYQINGDIISI